MAEQQQHQSSDAIRFEKQKEKGGDEEDENDDGEEEKQQQQRSEFQPRELSPVAPELETLEVDSTAQSGHYAGFGVNSEAQAQFQKQNGTSHQEILASVSSQPAQGQMQNLQQLVSYPTALSELSPTSVTQSISPAPSPILPEQRQSLQKVNSSCMLEEDKQNFHRSILPVPLVKTSASDGYNWRKYGQKQVKSPPGSRSYYRCSSTECSVKKIECCDHSGHTIGIVYKSQHTHEPPWRSNTREIKVATSAECVGNSIIESPCGILNDSELSTISKEPIQESSIPERKRQNSSDSDGNGDAMIKEDHEPESKRRLKKSNLECSDPLLKPSKKAKFVVHAAGDVGVSGDGYRWRKYGQKMVKGNPHPRNYYRCTSAGCPVRKHIETAGDNTNALIIAYKDIHDHDMPVPKKRHGPPSAALVAAAAPVAMSNLQIVRTDTDNQISSTQWSVDRGGELTGETLELGGEKAMESARTLLSIGFEIKPC